MGVWNGDRLQATLNRPAMEKARGEEVAQGSGSLSAMAGPAEPAGPTLLGTG